VARPVILTVDDDVAVSQAVARDLRVRYAERCWTSWVAETIPLH
jgi:hypothetical protein